MRDKSDSQVDYTPNDFRRSFDIINQAALSSQAYPQGGIRVRQQGDTTLITEHRDPYSFYWHLDKSSKRDDDSVDQPARDNIVEEYYATSDFAHVKSPDSHDSGIQLEYAQPAKPVGKKSSDEFAEFPKELDQEEINEHPESNVKQPLPPGWERHEDPRGFSYYWHVDSGTVQREPPAEAMKAMSYAEQSSTTESATSSSASSTTYDETAEHLTQPPPPPAQSVVIERAFRQTTLKKRIESDDVYDAEEMRSGTGPVRFAVRSLGWIEIAEENLTPERSSRAVNRAIVDLSTGRNDFMENVAKWGDGKELIMELDDHDLRLCDPDTGAVLHVQPIQSIRVWGVGRDNGRDFAYVARDRSTKRFMCHVFRCDTPARTIANTLRDICRRLMIERRPNSLPSRITTLDQRKPAVIDAFPTPMEEPKKIIRCHFLGVTQVPKATGIDVLNEAVDRLVTQVRTERWILVDVSIAPSTISITEVGGNQIAECRVRYLSFLGIGRDVKHCAFIMHMSSEDYMCYVFHVEPSAGAMAKTIEAACKLRYQKVIDAHGERRTNAKRWSESIRDVFGNLASRRTISRQHHMR